MNVLSYGGDVNGDSTPDILVGSCASPHSSVRAGAAFVIFGSPDARTIQLDGEEWAGFRIVGGFPGRYACIARSVGDVNGDGLDDVAIGAAGSDPAGRTDAGVVYVVFGKSDSAPVDLARFDASLQGELGFRIDGPGPLSYAGVDLGNAGDVNQDGLADLIVAAPGAAASYIVFGKQDSGRVDLQSIGRDNDESGYGIDHRDPGSTSGHAVAGGGDINGDGVPDAIVGLSQPLSRPGSVSVVYGQSDKKVVNARHLGTSGFKIRGINVRDTTGYAVANAGDVNGDSYDDVLLGAPRAYGGGGRGKAYVVFGSRSSSDVRLGSLGGRGFEVRGPHWLSRAGWSVAGLGDVNADGLDDVIVGAPLTRVEGRGGEHPYTQAGAAFVLFGRTNPATVRLARVRGQGYSILGAAGAARDCTQGCVGDWAGASVDRAGDVDGDGYADVLVGAPYAAEQAGRGYLLWNHPFLDRD